MDCDRREHMRFEWFVTRRYLKSKPERKFVSIVTFISMAGVALGVMTLIIVLGVMGGFSAFLLERIIGVESHLLVREKPGQVLADYRQVMRELEEVEHVLAVSPIVTNLVMLELGGRTASAVLKGIDLSREKKVTDLEDFLEAGALHLGEGNVLMGIELARNLGARLGDMITVIAPSYHQPKMVEYKIGGFFRSGFYEYDANLIYLALSCIQKLLGWEDVVTGIRVKLTDPYLASQVADSIRTELNLSAKTWMQFKPHLLAALELEKTIQFIIIVLIVVVAAFNIVSILDMMVSEKRKDIGTLKAIGATRGSIMTIFILRGLFIGLTGTVIGAGLGLGLSYLIETHELIRLPANIYYLTYIPVELRTRDLIYIISSAIVLTFLASLYPSWRASRLDPVEALRYE